MRSLSAKLFLKRVQIFFRRPFRCRKFHHGDAL